MKTSLLALAVGVACSACSASTTETADEPRPMHVDTSVTGERRSFSYRTIDGRAATSQGYRGRMTVVALAATYDTASQAQARFVNVAYRRHTPRINALLLVLEPPHHAPLVQAFASSLEIRYDVALADEDTIAGNGPFPGLHHVPSIVLLDRDGREVWRQLGVIDDKELSEIIRQHDTRAP